MSPPGYPPRLIMSQLSRMKRQHRYPPVGRCIYHSGSDWAGRLTMEHVIPEGLGGTLELPDAT